MYGLDWAIVTDPVARELHMCAKGGSWQVKGKTVGNGPAYHYKTGMMLLWPEIKWWKGCDLILDNYITHRSMAILGPASLGKTFLCSALALWDYFIDPQKTKVLICSTTAERMRDRIWGQVVRFHTLAKKHHSWLPGHVISGRMRLLTNERLDSDNPEDCGSGCMGLPCKRGENLITLSDFCFPPGTLVDTQQGQRPIETIKVGEKVMSALGWKKVQRVGSRVAAELVRVTLKNGKFIDCTPEHPFLTNMGWVNAIDLIPQHELISAHESMQILQKGQNFNWSGILQRRMQAPVQNQNLPHVRELLCRDRQQRDFLFKTLLGEMEDEEYQFQAAVSCFGPNPGIPKETHQQHHGESSRQGAAVCASKIARPGEKRCNPKKLDKTKVFKSKGLRGTRQWTSPDTAGKYHRGSFSRSAIRTDNSFVQGIESLRKKDGFSALLQTRFWVARHQIGGGDRRRQPFETETDCAGFTENQSAERAWVESVEVLERGSDERYDPSTGGYQVHNLQVEGHPSFSVQGYLVHNSGIKAPRLRLFGDEVQFLPIGFVHAISGLDKNPDLKVVGMGNPKDTIDALGILAEPSQELGGWDGGIDQQGSSKSWSTRRPDGCAVQLVCYDSPNLDGKFGAPLITQEQIDRDIAVYGKNSIQFTMLNEGRMPHGMSSKRILTRQECHLQKAHEAPLWLNSALTDIVYLDAAYGGVGGDRCILGHLKFGRESLAAAISEPNKDGIVAQLQPVDRNRQIIALETSMVLPIEITAKKTIVDQIVDFCKNYCVQRGIPPQNFFYDSGMRTALVQRFGEHWPGTNSIDCGGEPSDRNVSGDIQIPAKTYYRKKITELWYSVRWTVISGQMRSLPEDEMQELTSREWRMTAGNKIEVEPKPLMKSKFGRSPDKADGLAIGIEGARQKGFVIRRFVLPSKQNVKSTQWKQDLRQQARDLWNSGTIQEDAA